MKVRVEKISSVLRETPPTSPFGLQIVTWARLADGADVGTGDGGGLGYRSASRMNAIAVARLLLALTLFTTACSAPRDDTSSAQDRALGWLLVSDEQLKAIDVATGDVEDIQLAFDLPAWPASWAADGLRVAYVSDKTLFVADAGDSRPRAVRSFEALPLGVTWSPSGDEVLALLARGLKPVTEIAKVDVTNGRDRPIPVRPTGLWQDARWRGSTLVLFGDANGRRHLLRRTVWLGSPDGGRLHRILPGLDVQEVALSPDGDSLAVGHIVEEEGCTYPEVSIVDLRIDTPTPVPVAKAAIRLIWSPDGSSIAFLQAPPFDPASGKCPVEIGPDAEVARIDVATGERRTILAGDAVLLNWVDSLFGS